MKYRTTVILLVAISWVVQGELHGQNPGNDKSILARVGRRVVTVKELQERFELLPGPGRNTPGLVEAGKQDMLLSLVAEKLLANAAEENGMLRDTVLRNAVENIRRLLARDELYREEVQRKVKVSEAEIQSGIKRARRRLLVAYLFSEDRTPLDIARKRLRPGSGLERMVFDSTSGVLRDTITVDWGEAEATLEEAAFTVKQGSVSAVTRSSLGWFVLQVLKEVRNPEALQMDGASLRSNVENILRLRKEERRLEEFVNNATRGIVGRAVPSGFLALVEAIRYVLNAVEPCSSCTLGETQFEAVRIRLGERLNDSLLVMRDRLSTVGDGLTRLYVSGTRMASSEKPTLEQNLSYTFSQWVLQDILESLALERGLDTRPSVAQYIDMWQAHYLAEGLRAKIASTISVTDPDVYSYAYFMDTTFAVPTFDLRIATSRRLESIVSFYEAIMDGAAVDTVLRFLDSLRIRDVNLQVVRGIKLTSAGAYGALAWGLSPGSWSRPAKLDTASAVVQLIQRYDPPRTSAAIWDSLRAKASEAKFRRTLDVTVAGLARRQNVALFDELLPSVKVSSTPMMTYRILGFGGRMFAVPFVRPQTGWVEVESDQRPALP